MLLVFCVRNSYTNVSLSVVFHRYSIKCDGIKHNHIDLVNIDLSKQFYYICWEDNSSISYYYELGKSVT